MIGGSISYGSVAGGWRPEPVAEDARVLHSVLDAVPIGRRTDGQFCISPAALIVTAANLAAR
jgi:hypothetical protein